MPLLSVTNLTTTMSNYQDLLGCLDVIPEMDIEKYTVLPGWRDLPRPAVDQIGPKAALVTCDTIPGTWIPLSLMRCDTDGNLYLQNWKHEELASE